MENIEDLTDIVTTIIVILVLVGVTLISVLLMFNKSVEVETREMERFNIEIAHALMGSNLTKNGIFDWNKITLLSGSSYEPIFGCEYGYNTRFILLATKTIGGEEISITEVSFGYRGYKPTMTRFPIGVMYNGELIPAKLVITSYKDIATVITCMIHYAYTTTDALTAEFEDIDIGIKNCDDNLAEICITEHRPTFLLRDREYRRFLNITVEPKTINGSGTLIVYKDGNTVKFDCGGDLTC